MLCFAIANSIFRYRDIQYISFFMTLLSNLLLLPLSLFPSSALSPSILHYLHSPIALSRSLFFSLLQ